jgi:hypothetical protein
MSGWVFMIFADTLSNKIVFDIGPGDIGAGQRLVLSFLYGLTMAVVAPPRGRAVWRRAWARQIFSLGRNIVAGGGIVYSKTRRGERG